jgi:sulfate-transporting ATPase
MSRSFQSLELLEDLTVADNLALAGLERRRLPWLRDLVPSPSRGPSTEVLAAVEVMGLADTLESYPDELPYAERRRVAVARALAAAPSILFLDEPAAGLDGPSTRELGQAIRRVAHEWGIGVLLVEHDVAMVMSTCDRIVAIDFGSEIVSGTPDEVRQDPAVIAAYLGNEPTESSARAGHEGDSDSALQSNGELHSVGEVVAALADNDRSVS